MTDAIVSIDAGERGIIESIAGASRSRSGSSSIAPSFYPNQLSRQAQCGVPGRIGPELLPPLSSTDRNIEKNDQAFHHCPHSSRALLHSLLPRSVRQDNLHRSWRAILPALTLFSPLIWTAVPGSFASKRIWSEIRARNSPSAVDHSKLKLFSRVLTTNDCKYGDDGAKCRLVVDPNEP